MKKILLIIMLFMTSVASYCFESTSAQFPNAEFQSVNGFNSCVSYQPNITPVGASSPYQQTQPAKTGPRRVHRDDDEGDPFQTPVGDVPFLFMVVLLGVYLTIATIKEKTVSV